MSKPTVTPGATSWALAAAGAVLIALSRMETLSVQSVLDAALTVPDWHVGLAVLGGALFGVLKLGPGQLRLSSLPTEVRESIKPGPKPQPQDTAADGG